MSQTGASQPIPKAPVAVKRVAVPRIANGRDGMGSGWLLACREREAKSVRRRKQRVSRTEP